MDTLSKALSAIDSEAFGEARFVALLTLDSEMRYGLRFQLDDEGALADAPVWAMHRGGELTCFSPATAKHFVEVFEHDRRDFETRLEARARELNLPDMEVVFSFPAFELVRTMMHSESQHYTRMAISWLLPSELRDLRADLIAIRDNSELSEAIRSLAERLVVSE